MKDTELRDKVASFKYAMKQNGMSTFYHRNGLVFISDFLKEIENAIVMEKLKSKLASGHKSMEE